MHSKIAERSSALVARPPGGAWCSGLSLGRVAESVCATAFAQQVPTAPVDRAIPASWQAWPNLSPMSCPPWSA